MSFGQKLSERPRRGPLFKIAYDDYCRECGDECDEGDRMGYVDDEICCEDCWEEAG